MPGVRTVLFVKSVAEEAWDALRHLRRQIWQMLEDDPTFTLATAEPVDLAAAVRLVRSRADIGVIVLIDAEAPAQEAEARLLEAKAGIDIVTVAVAAEAVATVSLRDPDMAEIVDLIQMLVGRADAALPPLRSQVLRFAPRSPAAGKESGAAVPMVVAEGVDPNILDTLFTALRWAEAAARELMRLWSTDREEVSVFGVSREALEQWLARLVGIADGPAEAAERGFREFLNMLEHAAVAHTPMVRLADALGRDKLALKLFLVVLAPEIDLRFHRLYGALHDDLGRRRASTALACAIVAAATPKRRPSDIRAGLATLRRLRELRLIDGIGEEIAGTDEALSIDPRLLDWLVGGNDSRLLVEIERHGLLRPRPEQAIRLLPPARALEVRAAERRALRGRGAEDGLAAILLTGSAPGWIEAEAGLLAETEIRIAPPRTDMPAELLASILREALRAAQLTRRTFIVDLTEGDLAAEATWRALRPLLSCSGTLPYVLTANPGQLLAWDEPLDAVVVPLSIPSMEHRVDAVRALLGGEADEALAEDLAARLRVAPMALPDVPPLAWAEAAGAQRPVPDADDWRAAFRAVAGSTLPSVARRVPPRPAREGAQSPLDAVILPEHQRRQLEGIIGHVRVGPTVLGEWGFGDALDARGVSALFSGESGTGKTMAAHALASTLGADLYVVDLANMVSKYIGETEKNLHRVFTEAERSGAVLLFDEADALFGKRGPVREAHDRYANIEVAYLLQRMEQFDGLAILTTNHPENLDSAFTRRIRFEVEFPRPAAPDRKRIWEAALPQGPHREESIDFSHIARQFDFTGGSIRQIVLHALMAAALSGRKVGADHLREAIRIELVRLGAFGELAQLDHLLPPGPAARAA